VGGDDRVGYLRGVLGQTLFIYTAADAASEEALSFLARWRASQSEISNADDNRSHRNRPTALP
jgi:hypothetical protein